MPQRNQCVQAKPYQDECSHFRSHCLLPILRHWLRACLQLPTQSRSHQRKQNYPRPKPMPIGLLQAGMSDPSPEAHWPIRIQKNQRAQGAHEREPIDIIKDQKVICRMKHQHQHQRENSRSPKQKQEANCQIENQSSVADEIGESVALKEAFDNLHLTGRKKGLIRPQHPGVCQIPPHRYRGPEPIPVEFRDSGVKVSDQ